MRGARDAVRTANNRMLHGESIGPVPALCHSGWLAEKRGYFDSRSQRAVIAGSYVLLIAATAMARLAGLNPASLWWDDLWVAALAKASLREALTTPAPAPPGFLATLWLFRRLTQDPEWSLQLFPFLCGLAVIPLTGAVVSRITESSHLGLVAAAIVALNPMLATYSVFVKQFTLDASATALVLLAALAALDRPSLTALWAVTALGVVAFFFSLNSILASFLLAHVACLFALIDSERDIRAFGARLLPVIVFDVVTLVWFEIDVRHRSNPLLVDYWRRHFMSTASTGGAIQFLKTNGWTALREALPDPIGGFALLALPGFTAIAMRRPRLGVFLVLYLVEIIVLSRLHYVPLGGRTEAFAIPVFVVLILACIDLAPRFMPGRGVLHCALAIAAMVFAVRHPFPSRYFRVDDAFTVERLRKSAGPSDAVLVYPWASWLVAYYADWPYELRPSSEWVCNFRPEFRRPLTLVLELERRHLLSRQLTESLDGQQVSTVFYAETRENRRLSRSSIFAELDRMGYEGRLLIRSRKSCLYSFHRRSASNSRYQDATGTPTPP